MVRTSRIKLTQNTLDELSQGLQNIKILVTTKKNSPGAYSLEEPTRSSDVEYLDFTKFKKLTTLALETNHLIPENRIFKNVLIRLVYGEAEKKEEEAYYIIAPKTKKSILLPQLQQISCISKQNTRTPI